jgi:hypothetical protein
VRGILAIVTCGCGRLGFEVMGPGGDGSPHGDARLCLGVWSSFGAPQNIDRSVVWLSGVRRTDKTTLARSVPGATYFDCELVRVRRALEDPELFWRDQRGVIVLDEVHRLANPSEVLKIAADHFPSCKVIATGSSTLAARNKFKDALTGRKRRGVAGANDLRRPRRLPLDRPRAPDGARRSSAIHPRPTPR